ncbi:MAG: hypothetical protein DM484_04215 [Candidatus Methylumidiphilus alinenensis]|uniref:Glycosyl transferase family 1 domain-containing protein n=1 Tax=Candidatus Methylumidiphilus alinenensis TaxID=2202197 RepID=A0A2W4T8D1_9GAMM|nr:MAG: hypothetical protein DM484_04215 [Candidatus Methylumidiphilus alinenensis]
MKLIFDVYPLLNTHYTGIPQTTWHLARQFLVRKVDCLYTFGYRVLCAEEINHLVQCRSGRNWRSIFVEQPGLQSQRFLTASDLKERIYFSPHVMSCLTARGLGNARFVHDISSVTMPQFHHNDTVMIDNRNLPVDLKLCDSIFTVSESSKAELIRYLGVPESKITVAYPGVEWMSNQVELASKVLFEKPYVLVLATREPRKNLKLVLKYLVKNKAKIIAGELNYVFAGPSGWGSSEMEEGMSHALNELQASGKLLFAGFVPEELKLTLIQDAAYMIFPAFFEGFGSPVAEALSLGTPVACSFGGSLPEVGGDAAYYFSPDSLLSMTDAIASLEIDLKIDRRAVRLKASKQGEKFSWQTFTDTVLENLGALYARNAK